MRLLRNFIYLAAAVALLLLGVLFAVQNDANVPLNLLAVELAARPVAQWLLFAFIAGVLAGMAVNIGIMLRLRAALARANRQLSADNDGGGAQSPPAAQNPAAKNGGQPPGGA